MTGIIAEYNPFHNGHAYQISEIKKLFPAEKIVAVMSGSFTQRGTPAILDKWTRARLAVEDFLKRKFKIDRDNCRIQPFSQRARLPNFRNKKTFSG